jgi:hypothetical protein
VPGVWPLPSRHAAVSEPRPVRRYRGHLRAQPKRPAYPTANRSGAGSPGDRDAAALSGPGRAQAGGSAGRRARPHPPGPRPFPVCFRNTLIHGIDPHIQRSARDTMLRAWGKASPQCTVISPDRVSTRTVGPFPPPCEL